MGRLKSVTYDFGGTVNYGYDPGGNPTSVTVPPYVYGTDPVNGAVYVPVDQNVYITFSKNVQPGDNYAGIVMKTGGTVVTTAYSLSSSLLTINPVDNLDSSTTYAVYIPAGAVKDLSGNNSVSEYTLTFTTQSILSVVYTDPVDGAADVPVDKTVYLAFNKDIQPGPSSGGIAVKAGETVVSTAYSVYGSLLTIDPVENLNYSTAYAVYVPADAVQDLAGNNLVNEYSFGFTTSGEPDATPPTVTVSPPGGLYNAAQSVTLTASEPAAIYYTTDGTDPTTGSAQYAAPFAIAADTTLKFMAVDQSENQSVIYTETYTIDTAAPTVSNTDPADGATGVSVSKIIYVQFGEDIQPGPNYGSIMMKTGEAVAAIMYNTSGNVLSIDPLENLYYSTTYAVYLPTGSAKDAAENVTSQYILTFSTAQCIIHIDDIQVRGSRDPEREGWNYATALIKIVNQDGTPVAGATVSGKWSDLAHDKDIGVTDTLGQVTVTSDSVKKNDGCFTFTVDNVVKSGCIYDLGSNNETSSKDCSVHIP
ncbi:MAG: Ig-like domain-containing protein [Bacillota bacterium]